MVKDIYFDLLDESIVSNIREKKAKPNKSIIEHTNDLLDVLEILWNLGYIKEERIYELIQKACIYHDIGKINKEFIPGLEDIKERISCLQGRNSYTKETVEHMQNKMNAEEVDYISFEDSNTKGLTGAKNGQSDSKKDTWGI